VTSAWPERLRERTWAAVRAILDEADDPDALGDPGVRDDLLVAAELIAAGRGRPGPLTPAAEAFLDAVEGWPTAVDAARAAALLDRWGAAADDVRARLRW
jgi:hypothetical protein